MLFNGGDGSANRWLGYAEDACKQFFGDVVPMVDECHFECLGQGELVWFLVWFDPGEVVFRAVSS